MSGTDLASRLRRALLIVAGLTVAGTAAELAMLRHWKSNVQLVPWVVLVALAATVIAMARRPGGSAVLVVRVVAVAAGLSSGFGVFEHVKGNYEAGPLDANFTDRWATMSGAGRWWAAFAKTVGPSPSLAPGALALAALCVLFATLGHSTTHVPRQPVPRANR